MVVSTPLPDVHLSLGQREEELLVQRFVSALAVGALEVAVLTWTAGLHEQRLNVESSGPVTDPLSRQLSTVVRADVPRHAVGNPSPRAR